MSPALQKSPSYETCRGANAELRNVSSYERIFPPASRAARARRRVASPRDLGRGSRPRGAGLCGRDPVARTQRVRIVQLFEDDERAQLSDAEVRARGHRLQQY